MDKLKAAFSAAGGGMLPEPTDKEWQALLEWSQPGSKPPPGVVSYVGRCWHRDALPPGSLTREDVLRVGEKIIGLDLVGRNGVFRREKFPQFDWLAAIIREQHGLLPANYYAKHARPKNLGDIWVQKMWFLSVEFVITEILGKTIGGVDKGFELPWETINPGSMATLRPRVRREASEDNSPHKRRIREFKRSTARPTETQVSSGADGASSDHTPGRSLRPNGMDDPNDTSARDDTKEKLRLASAGQPNANQLSGEPKYANDLQPKPIDPQLTRSSVKDMLKALEKIDSSWDNYHKQLASAQDEIGALRVEVATKSKQFEEYERQASARLVEIHGLRERLEAKHHELGRERKAHWQVAMDSSFLRVENAQTKRELCRVLAASRKRDAENKRIIKDQDQVLAACRKRDDENARTKKELDQLLEAHRNRDAENARIKQELDQALAAYRKGNSELASSFAAIHSILKADDLLLPASEGQVGGKQLETRHEHIME
ncbi:hypothetical protein MAPG_07876 [Magnaporthiopsis poae ATCC 64411]|uniref:Uncharacterized protein n=1 Tax=Magnaporthiopsis poae (strain ATCC 64411 / 73-15) TaxID=644358 RepID=A0A0C4E5V1_MAGP6|nr:hypothetical protein MAPG_07876 [Magnaporthiopsis poae ATCC 64411]